MVRRRVGWPTSRQAADADHGVGQVDDGVPGVVEAGQDGADGDGLAGADLAGDDADGAFGDAPGDLPRAFRTTDLRLIHTAICCSRYSSWTCCGVRY